MAIVQTRKRQTNGADGDDAGADADDVLKDVDVGDVGGEWDSIKCC